MKTRFLTATGAVALLLGTVQPSHAAFELMLSDGNPLDTITVIDNGTGDTDPTSGSINISASIGAFHVTTAAGESKPLIGSSALPQLDLTSLDAVTLSGGGTLTISLSDIGFTTAGGAFAAIIDGNKASVDGTVEYKTLQDCGDANFAGTQLSDSGALSTTSYHSAIGGSTSVCAGPYSLTQVAIVSLPDIGEKTSFDATLNVPEPGTLALFGVGLLGLGAALRWRKRA